jgi:hypothetical protein
MNGWMERLVETFRKVSRFEDYIDLG